MNPTDASLCLIRFRRLVCLTHSGLLRLLYSDSYRVEVWLDRTRVADTLVVLRVWQGRRWTIVAVYITAGIIVIGWGATGS